MRIKRCKTHFGDVGEDLNLRLPFFEVFCHLYFKISRIFSDFFVNFLCLPFINAIISSFNQIIGAMSENIFSDIALFVFWR